MKKKLNKHINKFISYIFYRVHEEARLLQHKKKHTPSLLFLLVGLGSMLWLIIRSGRKPSRLTYPCQKVAAANSVVFLSWISGLFVSTVLSYRLKRRGKLLARGVVLGLTALFLVSKLHSVYVLQMERKLVQTSIGQTAPTVVWIRDTRAATGWSSDLSARVNASVSDEMMDTAIKRLTGQSTVKASWSQIFKNFNGGSDYTQGEKIAIKLNFNNSGVITNRNPNYQVVNSLLRQLVNEVGVSQSNIILYDASRPIQSPFQAGIRSRFPNVQMNPGGGFCGSDIWTGPNGSARLTCILSDAKYLINMPLLSTHEGGRVTLSLKNHLGSTNNPSSFHYGLASPYNGSYSLVVLNSQPWIKNKTILVVGDAMYGLKSGGPSQSPDSAHGIKPWPSSIFISTDPIAVDSVMIDYIATFNNNSFPGGEPRVVYQAAASAGLGTYETGYPNFSYGRIRLIRCTDSTCGGVVPTPTPSPTPATASPTPSASPKATSPTVKPGDANGDGRVDGLDYVIWVDNYGRSNSSGPSQGDFNADSRVDGLDYVIWIDHYSV